MKYGTVCGVLVGGLLGAGAVGLATTSLGQEGKAPKATPPAHGHDHGKDANHDAEMEMMMQLATPGAEHKALEKFVGTWSGKVEYTSHVTGQPVTSDGTMVNTMVLDGRFLRQEWSTTMEGMPFKGIGYWGYDNAKKEHVMTWMDTMGTAPMTFIGGAFDPATKTYTSKASWEMPGMPAMHFRTVTTVKNDTEHVFEMFMPGEGGKEDRMKITYTKK